MCVRAGLTCVGGEPNTAAERSAEFWCWEPDALGVRSSTGAEGGMSPEMPGRWKSVLLLGVGCNWDVILAISQNSRRMLCYNALRVECLLHF